MMWRPVKWLRIVVVALALMTLGASCGQIGIAIMPGVVNNPANSTLRREIFGFAVGELCKEMQKRSIPLKLRDADPSIGRFFPTGCGVQQMPNENLFVQFTGHGYAWTNVTGRMGKPDARDPTRLAEGLAVEDQQRCAFGTVQVSGVGSRRAL